MWEIKYVSHFLYYWTVYNQSIVTALNFIVSLKILLLMGQIMREEELEYTDIFGKLICVGFYC